MSAPPRKTRTRATPPKRVIHEGIEGMRVSGRVLASFFGEEILRRAQAAQDKEDKDA